MLLHETPDSDPPEEQQLLEDSANVGYQDDDGSDKQLVICDGNDDDIDNEMTPPPRQSGTVAKNKCEHCPFIAQTKPQLLYHKQFHRPNPAAIFKCHLCSYAVSFVHLLNQHLRVHELDNGAALQASEKDAESDGDESDSQDTSIVQHGKRKLYQCRFCPTTSKKQSFIFVHEKAHMKNSNENFKCSSCSFSTQNSTSFLNHFSTHNNKSTLKSHDKQADETNQGTPLEVVRNAAREISNSEGGTSFASPSVSVVDVNNIRHGNRRMFSYVCPGKPNLQLL